MCGDESFGTFVEFCREIESRGIDRPRDSETKVTWLSRNLLADEDNSTLST
jgi:hypothetical protein